MYMHVTLHEFETVDMSESQKNSLLVLVIVVVDLVSAISSFGRIFVVNISSVGS